MASSLTVTLLAAAAAFAVLACMPVVHGGSAGIACGRVTIPPDEQGGVPRMAMAAPCNKGAFCEYQNTQSRCTACSKEDACGCMDPLAPQFSPQARVDDHSCDYLDNRGTRAGQLVFCFNATTTKV